MSGLVLNLAPKERILINGAVVENGDRRTRFTIVTKDVKILRLRDAIHPDDANAPVARMCYVLQLVLTGDEAAGTAAPQLRRLLGELDSIFRRHKDRAQLSRADRAISQGNYYAALKALRRLLPAENELLAAAQA